MPEYEIPKTRWYTRLHNWLLNLFRDEYELRVWYVFEIIEDPRGLKTVKRKEKVYYLSDITKKTSTHIIGQEKNGKRFEIKTVDPFDYQIRKIK
jgi:hypothetical protein